MGAVSLQDKSQERKLAAVHNSSENTAADGGCCANNKQKHLKYTDNSMLKTDERNAIEANGKKKSVWLLCDI